MAYVRVRPRTFHALMQGLLLLTAGAISALALGAWPFSSSSTEAFLWVVFIVGPVACFMCMHFTRWCASRATQHGKSYEKVYSRLFTQLSALGFAIAIALWCFCTESAPRWLAFTQIVAMIFGLGNLLWLGFMSDFRSPREDLQLDDYLSQRDDITSH